MAKKSSASTTKTRQTTLAGASAPANSLSFNDQSFTDRPVSQNNIFKKCRGVVQDSSFLSAYIPLKASFYNFGFSITTVDNDSAQEAMLEEWLSTPYISRVLYTDLITQEALPIELNVTYGEIIRTFCRNVWHEFLTLDNCVGLWMDNLTVPTILALENCDYQDKLGSPIIRYTHGLGPLDYQLLGQDQVARFMQRSFILINPTYGEHFKVLKRAPIGAGFGRPRLYSLFRTLGEVESKEMGFYARAFQLRNSPRHHKLGYEIKQGNHAGKGTWHWNSKRDIAVRAAWKDRVGPWELTTNFDHEVTFPWPDLKNFDDLAWKGTDQRLQTFGGPLARLLVSGEVKDGGFSSMRFEVSEDRTMVRDFLKTIVSGAFSPPKELKWTITWSDLAFVDPSKFVEMFKLGAQQGFTSIQSAREILGLNHAKENARKQLEATDPNAKEKFLPMWDISHGISPALGQSTADKAPAAKPAATTPGGTAPRPVPAPAPSPLGKKQDPIDPEGLEGDCGGDGRTRAPYIVEPGTPGPAGPGLTGVHLKTPLPGAPILPVQDPKNLPLTGAPPAPVKGQTPTPL